MSQALWPIGQRVTLHVFNQSVEPPVACKPAENYWRLIGYTGHIIGYNKALKRDVIQFEASILALGLHCHHPTANNSLFILAADLTPTHCMESWPNHE